MPFLNMYKEYLPCHILAPYVDRYWEFKGQTEQGMQIKLSTDGCTDFMFILETTVRECNLNSVWFLFLLNHNKYNFFFLDLQMLLKVVFGCVQGRRRMSRLYTLAHIRELPFLCV